MDLRDISLPQNPSRGVPKASVEPPVPDVPVSRLVEFWTSRRMVVIAVVALAGIALHLILCHVVQSEARSYQFPLWIVLAFGGFLDNSIRAPKPAPWLPRPSGHVKRSRRTAWAAVPRPLLSGCKARSGTAFASFRAVNQACFGRIARGVSDRSVLA